MHSIKAANFPSPCQQPGLNPAFFYPEKSFLRPSVRLRPPVRGDFPVPPKRYIAACFTVTGQRWPQHLST